MSLSSQLLATPSHKQKHWVCAVAMERSMKNQAKSWVDIYNIINDKNYSLIKPNELKKVEPDDVLYLYCHSGYVNDENSPFYQKSLPYMISDFNKVNSPDKIYEPREFLKFLQDCGLNNEVKTVKIASCNSNNFAKLVAEEAGKQGIYPNMCISGYIGQLVLCQGKNNAKLAGLEEPYVIQDKNYWILNENEFIKNVKSKNDFQAKNYRKDFYVSNYLQDINSNSLSTSSDQVVSQAPTVAQARGVITTSPYPSILSNLASFSGDNIAKKWEKNLAEFKQAQSIEAAESLMEEMQSLIMGEEDKTCLAAMQKSIGDLKTKSENEFKELMQASSLSSSSSTSEPDNTGKRIDYINAIRPMLDALELEMTNKLVSRLQPSHH